jgi:hypothetical protein
VRDREVGHTSTLIRVSRSVLIDYADSLVEYRLHFPHGIVRPFSMSSTMYPAVVKVLGSMAPHAPQYRELHG